MRNALSLLAASALVAACGGDPAPKEVQAPTKKGHKSHRHVADADDGDHATKKHKHKKEDTEKSREEKLRELDAEAEREKQERKERQKQREMEAAADEQPAANPEGSGSGASDEAGDTDADTAADDDKAKKKQEADEAKAAKKQAAAEARAKKKQELEDAKARKKQEAEEARAKKQAALEEAKAKKQKKGNDKGDEKSDDKGNEAEETSEDGADNKTDDVAETASSEDEDKADEDAPKKKAFAAKSKKSKGTKKGVKKVAAAADKKAAKDDSKDKGKDKDVAQVDEDSIDMEEDDGTPSTPVDPSEDSNELDLSSTPTRPVDDEDETAAPTTTLEIDRRPLTVGKSKLEVHGGLRTAVVTIPATAMTASSSSTSEGLALGAAYGVGSKAEVGFDYTVGLYPGSAKGPLLVHGAFAASHNAKLDIAIAAGVALDFIDTVDATTMMTSTRTAKALQLGLWARYHVTPKLSAFSGLPALPSSSSGLSGGGLPPQAYQLSIGLSGKDAIGMDVPVGAGYQATPKIYGFGALDLAHLGMQNSTSAFLFADFIPISLGGFYAMNKLDIGAVFSDDLKQAADFLRFDVVVRYSLK